MNTRKIPIGKKVRVVKAIDETTNLEYLNKEGKIVNHNTNGMTGNCQSHPLHEVIFEDMKPESFWFDELEEL